MPLRRRRPTETEQHAIEHDGQTIPYTIRRSARRKKTIQITVEPARGVLIAAPLRARADEIRALVIRQAPWILRRANGRPLDGSTPPLVAGAVLPYRGATPMLDVVVTPRARAQVTASAGILCVALPATTAPIEAEEATRAALESWYRARSLQFATEAIDVWAPVTGKRPTRIFVRNQRKRWGSCSRDGTLRFNWRIAMLDPELAEYIVVHELSHLVHPNHSAAFWNHVNQAMPGAIARRAALKDLAGSLPL